MITNVHESNNIRFESNYVQRISLKYNTKPVSKSFFVKFVLFDFDTLFYLIHTKKGSGQTGPVNFTVHKTLCNSSSLINLIKKGSGQTGPVNFTGHKTDVTHLHYYYHYLFKKGSGQTGPVNLI
jgi:hypothetical protein